MLVPVMDTNSGAAGASQLKFVEKIPVFGTFAPAAMTPEPGAAISGLRRPKGNAGGTGGVGPLELVGETASSARVSVALSATLATETEL